jgi:hypothetical protein
MTLKWSLEVIIFILRWETTYYRETGEVQSVELERQFKLPIVI